MPVYIRSELEIPPPSESNYGADDDDFLLDPAQVFDQLPQPFRLVDEIIYEIVDDVWERVTQLEKQREEERKKFHPPVYEPQTPSVEVLANSVTFCYSADHALIFASFDPWILRAYNAVSLELVKEFSDESVGCIESITCSRFDDNQSLLACVDDMGYAKLFAFYESNFYLIQQMNELVEGSPRSNAIGFNFSSNSDYCAFASTSEGQAKLEVFKVPKEAWRKDLLAAEKEAQAALEALRDTPGEDEAASSVLEQSQGEEEGSPSQGSTPETAVTEAATIVAFKFTVMACTLRVKTPSALTGNNNTTSFQDSLDKVSTENIIGDGANHLFSEDHIAMRRATVHSVNEKTMEYLIIPQVTLTPSWCFLNVPGTLLTDDAIPPTSICVWWSNNYVVQAYELMEKPLKDVEYRAQAVWPMSDYVTCVSTSTCTNILAVGLQSGCISVVDRYLRAVRTIAAFSSPISNIHLIDGSIHTRIYSSPRVFALITLGNGQVMYLDCDARSCKAITNEGDTVLVEPLKYRPQLFLRVQSNGKCQVHFLTKMNSRPFTVPESIVCDFKFQDSLENATKRFVLPPAGCSLLHVKNDDSTVSALDLSECTEITDHFIEETEWPFIAKENIFERGQKLLVARMSKQKERTKTLSLKWRNLKNQLSVEVS